MLLTVTLYPDPKPVLFAMPPGASWEDAARAGDAVKRRYPHLVVGVEIEEVRR